MSKPTESTSKEGRLYEVDAESVSGATVDANSVSSSTIGSTSADFTEWMDLDPIGTAPSHENGRIALADGVDWDPDADGAGELVISDGASWIEIVDFGGTL